MKAFPHKGKITINETVCGTGMMSAGQRTVETDEPGMDLRDYFAAKAMNEMTWQKYEVSARRCYEIADAMMKAREQ